MDKNTVSALTGLTLEFLEMLILKVEQHVLSYEEFKECASAKVRFLEDSSLEINIEDSCLETDSNIALKKKEQILAKYYQIVSSGGKTQL